MVFFFPKWKHLYTLDELGLHPLTDPQCINNNNSSSSSSKSNNNINNTNSVFKREEKSKPFHLLWSNGNFYIARRKRTNFPDN